MKKKFIVLASLFGLAFVLIQSIILIKARASASKAGSRQANAQRASLSDDISFHAAGRGNPFVNLSDGRDLQSTFIGASGLEQTLESNQARPTALASADFDEHGVPDLICGYGNAGGGIITLHRGNLDTIFPNGPEAQQRRGDAETRGRGDNQQLTTDHRPLTTDPSPFLPEARVFDMPESPDFIGTGDFDADGHLDVVAAARGSNALYLLPGDGRGGLGQAQRIELPGRVTALVTGEINRSDGLMDVVVGVVAADGPKVMVFEGPDGALAFEDRGSRIEDRTSSVDFGHVLKNKPEVIALPAAATALALGQLDDDCYMDLAVAAGSQLLIVHGRDRRLSLDESRQSEVRPASVDNISLRFAITSMAVGDFTGRHQTELALLSNDGQVHLLRRDPIGKNKPTTQRTGNTEQREGKSVWKESNVLNLSGSASGWAPGSSPLLVTARVSSLPGDDLLVVDSLNHQLHILTSGAETGKGGDAAMRGRGEAERVAASLDVEGEPVAVLPMRLNKHAPSGLVILRKGKSAPVVALTAPGAIITVNDTADTNTRDTVLTLREAILVANGTLAVASLTVAEQAQVSGTPATPGLDEIRFNIPGSGVKTITPTSALPTITDPVTIDGYTQGVASANTLAVGDDSVHLIELNGNSALFNALTITAGNSTVCGLVINRFSPGNTGENDITLQTGGGNKVEGCFLGLEPTGEAADPGSYFSSLAGVVIQDSPNNTIGGTTPAARNVIAGRQNGIAINNAASSGTIIQGNYIGINAAGTTAFLNVGVSFINTGIQIGRGSGTGSSSNTIGGTTAGARNVISGTASHDILLQDVTVTGNVIQGNYLGTNATGTASVFGTGNGITLFGAGGVTIGGAGAGAGNLISGNPGAGINISNASDPAAIGNTIQGNLIGTNPAGTAAVGNGNGIAIAGGQNNTIGGATVGARNLISGNVSHGVVIRDSANVVQGNFIGTDITGTAKLGNGGDGVVVGGLFGFTVNGVTIGGTTAAARNVISGNGLNGIDLGDASTTLIQGNFVGTDAGGTGNLGNTAIGINVNSTNNTIGGVSAGAGNVIAFNGTAPGRFDSNGVSVSGFSSGISIRGNSIFSNAALGINLSGGTENAFLVTANDSCDADTGANNLQNFPVLTSATSSAGSTTIVGTLNSTAAATFTIDFYANPSCDASGNGEGQTFLGSTTVTTAASPDCSASFNVTTGAAPAGQNVVTATATDPSGNTSEFSACFAQCLITCPPNQTANTGPGATQCGTNVNYPAPTTTGNCGTVTCTPASGSLFLVGTTTVTCAVTGGPSCSFTVTVVDNTPPTITCPGNITQNTDPNQCSAVVTYTTPTPSDNCPGATAMCTPAAGSTFQKGVTTVTCTATDSSNNTGMCSFTVTVNDTQAPTIGACPANMTKSTDPNVCTAIVTFTPPTATDNCTPAPTVACSPQSGSTFNKGTTTVTCTATDSSNNTAMCSFTVTVNDTQAPTIGACPANITKSTDPNVCTAVVTFTPPTATDNCTPAPTVACSPTSGSTFNKGTTTVTCTATDSSNNTAMCSFTVTVNDTQAPTITCPANTTTSTSASCAVVNYNNPTVGDNCPGVGMPICSPPPGTCFPQGITTVTCNVKDASNNMASCSFTVTVTGTQPLSITCPSNISAAAAAACPIATGAPVNFTVTASGVGVTVVCKNQDNQVVTSGSPFPVGTTTVTCTATDASGNTATCSFTVSVFSFCLQDETNPGNVVLVNAQTGDFSFCCGGVQIASGRGTLTTRGCIGSIDNSKGDRQVHIQWDTSANNGAGEGTAYVQKRSTRMVCQITDKNISNNTCQCSNPPPVGSPKKPPSEGAF